MEISLLADKPDASGIIAQWYYDEWLTNVSGITVEDVSDQISKTSNRDKVPLTVIAHKNNELIGAIQLKLYENKIYPEYEHWLGGMYVKSQYRGQGVSTILIKQAIKHALQASISCLYLQCESHNINLYKKHGFKFLHEGKHRIPVSIMMLALKT